MAGTTTVEKLLRLARAQADAESSGALRRRDRDLAKLAQSAFTAAGLDDTLAGRQARLSKFLTEHGVKQADVAITAKVKDADVSHWKAGKIPGWSQTSLRIEQVLSGERPLKKRHP